MILSPAQAALTDWGWAAKRRMQFALPKPDALRREGARSVVMLPGVWERWWTTWRWGQALHGAGFDVRFIPEIDLELGTIDSLAKRVLEQLDQQGITRPILVAHSKGGLVGKQAMVTEPGRILGLVACGTPFDGAPLARLTPPALKMSDLVPEAQQIRRLAQNTDANRRIASIEARWDQDVPAVGALPGGLYCQVPVIGHHQLLADPVTSERIVQFAEHMDEKWGRA